MTVFNDGCRADWLPLGARHLRGDRTDEAQLRTLAGSGHWDAVVDISGKIPAVVQRSVRALARVAERYVSVVGGIGVPGLARVADR